MSRPRGTRVSMPGVSLRPNGYLIVPRVQVLAIALNGLEHFEDDRELPRCGLAGLDETADHLLGGQPLARQRGLLRQIVVLVHSLPRSLFPHVYKMWFSR